jgi:hypothetical protein
VYIILIVNWRLFSSGTEYIRLMNPVLYMEEEEERMHAAC